MYSVKLTNSAGLTWYVGGFATYKEAMEWLYQRTRPTAGTLTGKVV